MNLVTRFIVEAVGPGVVVSLLLELLTLAEFFSAARHFPTYLPFKQDSLFKGVSLGGRQNMLVKIYNSFRELILLCCGALQPSLRGVAKVFVSFTVIHMEQPLIRLQAKWRQAKTTESSSMHQILCPTPCNSQSLSRCLPCVMLTRCVCVCVCVCVFISPSLHPAYSTFYIIGLVLSMQIPFVGFQPIRTSEHMAAAGQ